MSEQQSITSIPTYDNRRHVAHRVSAPVVHVAHGFGEQLPFLSEGRPVVCLADWQVDTETQTHFWAQVLPILVDNLGAGAMARAIVLVAGDMASASNELRGVKSDAVPQLHWLRESVPRGDVLFVYGNHDLTSTEHLAWRNPASRLPCMLPHGAALAVPLRGAVAPPATPSASAPEASGSVPASEKRPGPAAECAARAPCVPTAKELAGLSKQERKALWAACTFENRPVPSRAERQQRSRKAQAPEEADLLQRCCALHVDSPICRTAPVAAAAASVGAPCMVVGAVHGIPASHTQGLRKIARDDYFDAVAAACAAPGLDVLVTHFNPRLPGQEQLVRGEDAPRLHAAFLASAASLHVHGHHQTEPAVAVVAPGKVVANVDNRVVVFVPPESVCGMLGGRRYTACRLYNEKAY